MIDQELIPHSTINTMIDNWDLIRAKLKNSIDTLKDIDKQLEQVFGGVSLDYKFNHDYEKTVDELQRGIWRSIINKTEIKKFLSIQRQKELSENIQNGKMEELTVDNIINMLKSASFNIPTLMDETIKEVFGLLRPHNSDFRNNEKFAGELGKMVVLEHHVHIAWTAGKFRCGYHYEDRLRAINNAFFLMDGKGYTDSYNGELYEAIEKSPSGQGETTYFKFKCYKNGNLHLTFKRLDLVKKMNGICAGKVLRRAV